MKGTKTQIREYAERPANLLSVLILRIIPPVDNSPGALARRWQLPPVLLSVRVITAPHERIAAGLAMRPALGDIHRHDQRVKATAGARVKLPPYLLAFPLAKHGVLAFICADVRASGEKICSKACV